VIGTGRHRLSIRTSRRRVGEVTGAAPSVPLVRRAAAIGATSSSRWVATHRGCVKTRFPLGGEQHRVAAEALREQRIQWRVTSRSEIAYCHYGRTFVETRCIKVVDTFRIVDGAARHNPTIGRGNPDGRSVISPEHSLNPVVQHSLNTKCRKVIRISDHLPSRLGVRFQAGPQRCCIPS
jgi:hypothetical protein